jgi:hypothetical protein
MRKEIMNIKKRASGGIKAVFVLALVFGVAVMGMAQGAGALGDNPAYLNIDNAFDFSKIKPTVNFHMPKFLLNNLMSQMNGGPDDPFAGTGINIADLMRDIQLIRVVVFETKDSGSQEIVGSGIQKLKKSMNSKWMPIVNVPDGNVTVFAMGDETGQKLAGLAIMVAEKNSVVIGNIIGDVPIGKIIAAANKIAANSKGKPGAPGILEKLIGGFQSKTASPDSGAAKPAGQESPEANPQGQTPR